LAKPNVLALEHVIFSILVTTNFVLFLQLKSFSKGRSVNAVGVAAGATRALAEVLKNGFQECFQKLYEHWQKWVTTQGNRRKVPYFCVMHQFQEISEASSTLKTYTGLYFNLHHAIF
jgi:hypothetical protein